jgi:hypothetical protein
VATSHRTQVAPVPIFNSPDSPDPGLPLGDWQHLEAGVSPAFSASASYQGPSSEPMDTVAMGLVSLVGQTRLVPGWPRNSPSLEYRLLRNSMTRVAGISWQRLVKPLMSAKRMVTWRGTG